MVFLFQETKLKLPFFHLLSFPAPKNTDNAGSLKIHSWDPQYSFSNLEGFSVNNFCQALRAVQSSAATDRSNYSSCFFCASLSQNMSRITEQFLGKLELDPLCCCYSEMGNHKNLFIFGLWHKGIHSYCLWLGKLLGKEKLFSIPCLWNILNPTVSHFLSLGNMQYYKMIFKSPDPYRAPCFLHVWCRGFAVPALVCTLHTLSVYSGFDCSIDCHLIKASVTLLVNPITCETLN